MRNARFAALLVGCLLVGLVSLYVGLASTERARVLDESETHFLWGGTKPCAQTSCENDCRCQIVACRTIECAKCWYYGPGQSEPIEMLCKGQETDVDPVEGCFDKDAEGYSCEVTGPEPSLCTVDAWPPGTDCDPAKGPVDSGPVRGGDCD